jgi:putative endonuclease
MDTRKEFGKWGEETAVDYLIERGYRILDRNVYSRRGEIDIIAEIMDQGSKITVFVEVKTRSSRTFGYPEEAVNDQKKEHILSSAASYLQKHPQRSDHWRVDVISVERHVSRQKTEINHFKNVFS